MDKRNLTEEEVQILVKRHTIPITDLIVEVIVYSFLFSSALFLLLLISETLFPSLKTYTLKTLFFVLTSLFAIWTFSKKLKQNQAVIHKIRSGKSLVEIFVFDIIQYNRTRLSNTEYTLYVCKINPFQTLIFYSELFFENGLHEKIKLELFNIVYPIILNAENIENKSLAQEVFFEKFNEGYLEEFVESDFAIVDKPFEEWFR